jgi:hypothetical protein
LLSWIWMIIVAAFGVLISRVVLCMLSFTYVVMSFSCCAV